jgi:hypothetical protein
MRAHAWYYKYRPYELPSQALGLRVNRITYTFRFKTTKFKSNVLKIFWQQNASYP